MNREFIRITLDTTNDVGIFLVESFEELGRARNPDNVVLNGACYDALTLRYDENQEYQLYGRKHFWTYQEGSLPCSSFEKQVIIEYTTSCFTFGDEPTCGSDLGLEMEDNKYLEPEHFDIGAPFRDGDGIDIDNKPFRSFYNTIKDAWSQEGYVGDLSYRAPETFSWTEMCICVYHILRVEKDNGGPNHGFISISRIMEELTLRWVLTSLHVSYEDILGMLQEMQGVKLVTKDSDYSTCAFWKAVV